MLNRSIATCASAVLLLLTACSGPKPIVVGSKDSTEQRILAEIVALHLEHRLGVPVQRRFSMGDTRTVHQAMLNGEIGLYPEYSGLVVSELLKETPSGEASVIFERARLEMKRVELVEFMVPLGFDTPTALVVAAAGNETITTVTQAASSPTRWKVGVSYDFQNRSTGIPALSSYRLEMGAPLRSMKDNELFAALEQNTVSMITANMSNPQLLSSTWKVLTDDQHAFPPAEAALLVRDDVLTAEPNLRQALTQLTGKISLDTMRKMNAQVVIDERTVEEVAAEFLKSAGLN